MKTRIVFVVYFISISWVCCLEISLNGDWFLKDDTGEHNGLVSKVPGGVYSDLMQNQIIPEILYGNNDVETRWVGKKNWIYYKNLTVSPGTLNYENINLVFEGLDTHAIIYINGAEIGRSQNMFVRYIFDITNHLKYGANNIEVKFLSPIVMANNLTKNQDYVIPPECPPSIYNGECYVNQLRKMQASFAWDWGPAFPSVGIWKSVYIEAFNVSKIHYLMVDLTSKDADSWNILVRTYLSHNKEGNVTGHLSLDLELDQSRVLEEVDVNAEPNEHNEVIASYTITIPKSHVKLWWPNGYGDQKLYTLSATFTDATGLDKSDFSVNVGFRTVELVQDTLDSGLTFYFKVNDVPIFAKGSNSIPIHILPELGQDESRVKYLLESAKDSHINMLRVWGGGVYESDYFYETCDRLGILIWQDFMFACAMYPSYEGFLNNVLEEVNHQVKRLNHHPSIVLWAGNNENELALVGNWYSTGSNFNTYKNDYLKLYIHTIMTEVNRISPNTIFLSSSPTNGKESAKENYIANAPGNPLFGDVHFYNYIFDCLYDNVYPTPRFASEYGYQSLPSIESFLQVTNDSKNLVVTSPFMAHRQHHPFGNSELMLLVEFQLGTLNSSDENYFKHFIFCTQLIQAMSMKIETEHYRRYRSSIDASGKGFTMGALYWQLNDVWVAPTWSGIDYFGQWKMLQYYIKNSFSPLIVSGYVDVSRDLNIFLVSDLQTAVPDMTLRIKVFGFSSLIPLNETELTVHIDAAKSNSIFSANVDNHLSAAGCGDKRTAKNNCFIHLSLEKNGVAVSPDNFVFASDIKNLKFNKVNLKITDVSQTDELGKGFSVTTHTDNVALFVWLDTHGIAGRFSENGFMQVNDSKTVYFTSEEAVDISELKEKLTVTSLMDIPFNK